jgi:hypothetical protein
MIMLYLDPGSGSILLQLLIAGLAGIGIAIGSQWAKIKRFFKRKDNQLTDSGNDKEDEDE